VSYAELKVSQGDGAITQRFSPDISLRNGLPVITYQGKFTKNIIYNLDQQITVPTLPPSTSQTFYPIVVRYATSTTAWSNFVMYNSDGTSTQQNPNIEGCTSANAYMLNFSKNNTQFKHLVKGDNLAGYVCEPSTFTGTDVKLVKGSYTSETGSALRTTLTPSGTLYQLDENSIDVSSGVTPSYADAYGNIKGVINMNNTDYIFDLGPIIIKSGEQQILTLELNYAASNVATSSEFNEYMSSSPFDLSNGDTLILGTTAFHKKPTSGTFEPVVYRVNLVNSLTDEIQRELFCDTVNNDDESYLEYYRGFILDGIEMSPSSFIVQVKIEDLSGTDAKYTFSGVYDGDAPLARGGDLIRGRYVDFGNMAGNINNTNVTPVEYALAQNYPNPFNPSTNIQYDLPKDGFVKIKIYDMLGKEVASLVNEHKMAGSYLVSFSGASLSSGVYFYRIETSDFIDTKRMILMK